MREFEYKYINIFYSAAMAMSIFCSPFVCAANQSMEATAQERARLHQSIINNRLALYNNSFKDIHFIHLNGGDERNIELSSVLSLIGENPLVLDYQHPKDLQNDVLIVTIARLRQMLEYDVTSSTLFRVGENNEIDKSNLCVVSLNTAVVVANELEALRYMLEYDDEVTQKIHPSRYLNTSDQLRFLLDHEIFHCLDTYLYGGMPMTFEKMGGEYNQLRRESAADAYALSIHLKKYGEITDFARNIVHIRALSMFNNSPSHHTFETVTEILRLDINELKDMNMMELISFVIKTRDKIINSYHDYIDQQAAELRAAILLGIEPLISEDAYAELDKIEIDQHRIELVIEHYRYFYNHLFTDTSIDLSAGKLH